MKRWYSGQSDTLYLVINFAETLCANCSPLYHHADRVLPHTACGVLKTCHFWVVPAEKGASNLLLPDPSTCFQQLDPKDRRRYAFIEILVEFIVYAIV